MKKYKCRACGGRFELAKDTMYAVDTNMKGIFIKQFHDAVGEWQIRQSLKGTDLCPAGRRRRES